MPARLLDTNFVSFIHKKHQLVAAYQPHLIGYDLAISFQTLGELFAGGVLAAWGDKKWAQLDATLAAIVVLESENEICFRWAEVQAARRARPIGLADCWIAATALAFGLELVTHNPSDFAGFPGLIVITEAP